MILAELIAGFTKVGCFSFGGAYGAIPLIRDVVLQYGWITEEHFSHVIALAESTPGPLMVNMATYIGSTAGGLPGAAAATAAVVMPSFIVILIIMACLRRLLKHPYAKAVLGGLKPCIIGIVSATGVWMTLKAMRAPGPAEGFAVDWRAAAITAALAAGMALWKRRFGRKMPPVTLICIAAVLGVLLYLPF